MIWPLITEFIGLIPMFIVVGMVLRRKRQLDKDSRRDPLTTELLGGFKAQVQQRGRE